MSNVAVGNAFRDTVCAFLRSAGFDANTEVLVGGKVVDVLAQKRVLGRNELLAIEAKDYTSNVPMAEVAKFISEYGNLLRNGRADRSILVTRGDITPQGRLAIIDAVDRVDHFTWQAFQRSIFGPDEYLASNISEYQRSGLEQFFIPPRANTGDDLLSYVHKWISENESVPLVILGGYGTGKSTFAQRLNHDLAIASTNDPQARIPILVPLGELAEENKLAGLFGQLLASRYRVDGYHYDVFRNLNRAGRLVIILDGLDEMKHGMTPSVFRREVLKLFELHEGDSRIILLGRRNALGSDQEFRSVIKGKMYGGTGEEFESPNHPNCKDITLDNWKNDEALRFVDGYCRHLAKDRGLDDTWVDLRIAELNAPRFAALIERPVHAQMLCQVAINDKVPLGDLDEFGLYDRFVSYLLARETEKIGRFANFDIDCRRRFNAAVSWWLLTKMSAIGASKDSIPISICKEAVKDIAHDFDEESLRQELVAGCLIEKWGGHVYFGHRSIQEFLAAEHLFNTNLNSTVNSSARSIEEAVEYATPEVSAFLVQFYERHPEGKEYARDVCDLVRRYEGDLPLAISPLAAAVAAAGGDYGDNPWLFLASARGTTVKWPQNAQEDLIRLLGNPGTPRRVWLMAAQAITQTENLHPLRNQVVAAIVSASKLAQYVEQAFRDGVEFEVPPEDPITACLVAAISVTEETLLTERVHFSWAAFRSVAYSLLGYGLLVDEDLPDFNLIPQQIYTVLGWSSSRLDRIRPFFNEPRIVRLLQTSSVIVNRMDRQGIKKLRAARKATPASARPILTLDRK